MTEEPIRPFAQALLSAWQAALKKSSNSNLKYQRVRQQGELLPRFAEHYEKRTALLRRMQWSLQRGMEALFSRRDAPKHRAQHRSTRLDLDQPKR